MSEKTVDRLKDFSDSERKELLSNIINTHVENMYMQNYETRPEKFKLVLSYLKKFSLWNLRVYFHRFDQITRPDAESCITTALENYPLDQKAIASFERQKKNILKNLKVTQGEISENHENS